jgi:cytochrome c-type biogenesis protein CcmH/NrfG
VGDTLAQALALLEEGKDREAEALLLTPQEGPLEAERLGEDLEVWEALLERLPPEDPRLPLARARVARLRREWGL